MKTLRPIPKFKNEEAERSFWARHDLTEYIDWSKAERVVFPNLQSRAVKTSIPKKATRRG
ncbi:MAG: CopG family antitoxin [Candidatus Coatesbacteria bacterium]